MTKHEFTKKLHDELKGYPREQVEDSIQYYSEMIDDRMEDGMPEEAAVAKAGDPVAIAKQIKYNMPLKNVIKEKVATTKEENKGKEPNVGLIVLLILGAPLWIPLALLTFVLVGVFFLVLWIIDLVLYIVALAGALTVIVSIVRTVAFIGTAEFGTAIAFIGMSIGGAGIAILLVLAGVALAKGIVALTAGFGKGVKRAIIGK